MGRQLKEMPSPSSYRHFSRNHHSEIQDGLRIASLLAMPSSGRIAPTCLLAILSDDRNGSLLILSTEVADSYPAITPECPQAHLFEREIYETHAIRPEGHPWLKPVRFLSSETGSTGVKQTIGKIDFFTVDGSEVHEVAVGPVHAGIIEPVISDFSAMAKTFSIWKYRLDISIAALSGLSEPLRSSD